MCRVVEGGQRIDKFLWHARLARSRSLAKKIAERGHIRCNGRRIDRAHAIVRIGDVLSVPLPRGARILRIGSLPPRRVSARQIEEVYSPIETIAERNR
ncbi:MAG: RNA-binding S4 domain-containing protein [Sphingomonadaceae bacterium]|nr:RNA-binding S4 domain-containing protein [Sphingomonadaceae bacterium]